MNETRLSHLGRDGDADPEAREQSYRLFFETAPVGATQISLADGSFVLVNALCQITGYTREELRVPPADFCGLHVLRDLRQ